MYLIQQVEYALKKCFFRYIKEITSGAVEYNLKVLSASG